MKLGVHNVDQIVKSGNVGNSGWYEPLNVTERSMSLLQFYHFEFKNVFFPFLGWSPAHAS